MIWPLLTLSAASVASIPCTILSYNGVDGAVISPQGMKHGSCQNGRNQKRNKRKNKYFFHVYHLTLIVSGDTFAILGKFYEK